MDISRENRLDKRRILSIWYGHAHMTPEMVPPSAHGFPQPRNTLLSQSIAQYSWHLHPHSCTAGIHDGASERETPGTLQGTNYQFSARRIPSQGGNRIGGNPGNGVLRNFSASKHFEGKHTLRGFRHTNISARHLYPWGIRASLKPPYAEDWFRLGWFLCFERSVFKAHSTFCSRGILRAYISVLTGL